MFLKLDSISSYYGNTKILREVSFEVPEGSCLCVLGRNGVGKTTLLKTIMGLMDKTTGRIELHGNDINSKRTDERAKFGIGYIPQGRQILSKFTVRENIMLGTFARKLPLRPEPFA